MRTDTLPWTGACEALAESVRRELSRHCPASYDRPVIASPLGLRDEFAVTLPPAGFGTPAVPVLLNGRNAIVGPFALPGRPSTACQRCLARRWQLTRPDYVRDGLEGGGPAVAVGEPPLLTPFTITRLAALIAAGLEQEAEGAYPFVFVLDLATAAASRTRLVPDPDCPACGTPRADTAEAAVVAFVPSPKAPGGGFRQRTLADLNLPVDALANPVCGLVGEGAIPVITLPTTASVNGSFAVRSDTRNYEVHWGGHTNTFAASRLVGVLEGLERHAGVIPRGLQAPIRASLTELGAEALDPRDCGVYSDDFYATDPQVRPFAPDRPIDWVWGYSLRDERPILVPLVLTYYHHAPKSERFVQECSNGCASGSSLVEAVYCGLSEVVERDAFLLSWYGEIALPEIDPATSTRVETRIMVDRLRMYGYQPRFFDARTATTPMPVVVAVADRLDGGVGALCFGAGAGLDPEDALASALDEIATDSVLLRGRTERDLPRLRALAADFDLVRALHDHPMLYGVPEMRKYAEFLLGPRNRMMPVDALRPPIGPSPDLAVDVRRCVAALAGEGFDVIVVNQTSPEQRGMGLHTASVLVPGLVPIDFGWRRQRVLTMPRLLKNGAGLTNPAPHPFP
jgi:ribosomal protein S12 methylthiotransferase accessory factor